ncbi:MAG: 2OG-Fe(II) oxygenase family protein [Pseudomonadota bacterium]
MSIPEIDASATGCLPSALDAALRSHGFFRVTNAAIAPSLVHRVFAASEAFFLAQHVDRERFAYGSAQENFGYQALGEERLDQNAPPDLKQTFTMRNVLQKPPADSRWPTPEFASLMREFFAALFDQALWLQRLIAEALDVEQDFFTRCHGGENVTLRLLHYPPVESETIAEGQLGAGAHTDYGLLTLLVQDAVGGLQVLGPDDKWLDVAPVAGTVIVNAGDLLERWTNGRYRSALHRVRPTAAQQRYRQSLVLFVDPDSATEVSVLDSCTDAGNPARFPTVSAGEHLQQRINASHQ